MPTTYANLINNNPIYAARAEADAAGNSISTTYATKSELPSGVPAVTSSDNDKVLKATYSGGAGSYEWASTPPANAIILTSSSTWSDFHTPYSAGRKDIYFKYTSSSSPFDYRAELYLHLTAVSDVDGSSNFTFAWFEGAWGNGGNGYIVRCKFRYSGSTLYFIDTSTVDQSYSSSSASAQSGKAVAQAISAVNQVPASTSADENKVLTVDSSGAPVWAASQGSTQVQSDWTESDNTDPSYIQNKPTVMGLTAGSNVTITEGVSSITIAATNTTYTAGTGLTLSNGEFAVDSSTVAMKTDIPSVPVTDVTVDGASVVSNGTAVITMPTVPTAGNMLSVTNGTLNVTTTAGITDIQQVASLPANPVATVLYLIPET